jgi:hypothetical protein
LPHCGNFEPDLAIFGACRANGGCQIIYMFHSLTGALREFFTGEGTQNFVLRRSSGFRIEIGRYMPVPAQKMCRLRNSWM